MNKTYVCTAVALLFFIWSASGFTVFAQGKVSGSIQAKLLMVPGRSSNPIHPKTKKGVLRAYSWLVHSDDGVNRNEALIIAQKTVIDKGLESQYDLAKPKIIQETPQEWIVRVPGWFQLNTKRGCCGLCRICINKADGRITCFERE